MTGHPTDRTHMDDARAASAVLRGLLGEVLTGRLPAGRRGLVQRLEGAIAAYDALASDAGESE